MIRLSVVVEGQTEERFVKDTLAPHLARHGVFATPIIVTTRRDPVTSQKEAKGGGCWAKWRKDLLAVLRGDRSPDARVTTLFDLYGLPSDFPELAVHSKCPDTSKRAGLLEHAMAANLDLDDQRFLPYLQRHEFEALVLCGLDQLEKLLDAAADVTGCAALRASVAGTGPEDVDDGPSSAPSKRLLRAVGSYDKVVHGPLVVEAVGLPALRARCPRLDDWVQRLEKLAS